MTAYEPVTSNLNFLWLEITQKCNLECIHCYVESGPKLPLSRGMDELDWVNALVQARAAGCKSVQFIGGEPTIHPSLPTLLATAYALGYQFIEVFSNATKISKSLLDRLQRYGVRLATSFYTSDGVLHDQIVKKNGAFTATVSTIKSVLDAGVPIRVEIVEVDGMNTEHEKTTELLKSFGVDRVSISRVQSVGRGTSSRQPRYSAGDLCGQCWKGRLCITSSGDAYPCIMSRSTLVGNFKRATVQEILQSSALSEFRSTMRKESASHRPGVNAHSLEGMAALSSDPKGLDDGFMTHGVSRFQVNSDCSPGPQPDICGPGDAPVIVCGPTGDTGLPGLDDCGPGPEPDVCAPA